MRRCPPVVVLAAVGIPSHERGVMPVSPKLLLPVAVLAASGLAVATPVVAHADSTHTYTPR